MTDDDLRTLLRGPEGPRVEFKEAANRDRVKRTAVAFANRLYDPEPGVLFIGVKDDGSIVGVSNADDTQRDIRRYVEECYPRIQAWEVRPLSADGDKTVVALIVPESKRAPHFTGEAYVRRGSESIVASTEMYEQLLANHVSPVRLLGPYVGQEIEVEAETTDHRHGRVWSGSRPRRKLLAVDEIGITVELSGAAPITADWSRVKLQPIVQGRPPYVRIALD